MSVAAVITIGVLMQIGGGGGGSATFGTPDQTQTQPSTPQAAPVEKVKRATLSGQVVSVTGEPLRKADVTLRRTDSRDMMGSAQKATTDASGIFTFIDLEPGRYSLMVDKTGFVSTQYGAARNSRFSGATIRLSAGQDLKGLAVKMMPHAVITGKVLDEEGEPIAHVQVQAMQQRYFRNRRQWMPSGGAQVNDLGEYRLSGLAPGRYVISVMPQRFGMGGPAARQVNQSDEGYVTTYYPGSTDPAQATPIEVASGGEMQNVNFRLSKSRTYRIKGKVLDAEKPARNVMVMLVSEDGGGFGPRNMSPVRNNEGTFEIANVMPGTYTVVANRMGNNDRAIAREQVTISDQNVDNVVLSLAPGFSVSGAIKVEGKNKMSTDGLRVFLEPQSTMMFGGGAGSGEVKEDGTFKLDGVIADKYRARVIPLTDGYIRTVRVGNQESRDLTVDLTSGGAGPIEVVVSSDAASIDGVIQDSKKRPAPGVVVALVPAPSLRNQMDMFKNASTDATGTFSFKGIPPGEYKVFAWENIEDFGWYDPAILSRYENDGKAVSLKEGAHENLTMGYIAPEGGSQIERENDEREKADNK